MKILIVEDLEFHRKLIGIMLTKVKDVEVISVPDAFEAYVALKAISDIGLLILDNKMPCVNGLQFFEYLRKHSNYSHIPIIFSSADNLDMDSIDNGCVSVDVKQVVAFS